MTSVQLRAAVGALRRLLSVRGLDRAGRQTVAGLALLSAGALVPHRLAGATTPAPLFPDLRAPPAGRHVPRVIADPANLLFESDRGADGDRESPASNEGMTAFTFDGTQREITIDSDARPRLPAP